MEWLAAILLLSGCTLDRTGVGRISLEDGGSECREDEDCHRCTDGETRTAPCGMCGTATERCEGGVFVAAGACTGEGECAPGSARDVGPCERCGVLRQTCGADCFYPMPVCEGSGACEAAAMETESRTCGACSTETRARTCNAGCAWDAFGPWSTCVEACMPGTTLMTTMPCGACGRGSQAAVQTCTSACVYGPPTPAGSCSGDVACTVGAVSICPGSGAYTREGCDRGAHWCQCVDWFGRLESVCTRCG